MQRAAGQYKLIGRTEAAGRRPRGAYVWTVFYVCEPAGARAAAGRAAARVGGDSWAGGSGGAGGVRAGPGLEGGGGRQRGRRVGEAC